METIGHGPNMDLFLRAEQIFQRVYTEFQNSQPVLFHLNRNSQWCQKLEAHHKKVVSVMEMILVFSTVSAQVVETV